MRQFLNPTPGATPRHGSPSQHFKRAHLRVGIPNPNSMGHLEVMKSLTSTQVLHTNSPCSTEAWESLTPAQGAAPNFGTGYSLLKEEAFPAASAARHALHPAPRSLENLPNLWSFLDSTLLFPRGAWGPVLPYRAALLCSHIDLSLPRGPREGTGYVTRCQPVGRDQEWALGGCGEGSSTGAPLPLTDGVTPFLLNHSRRVRLLYPALHVEPGPY